MTPDPSRRTIRPRVAGLNRNRPQQEEDPTPDDESPPETPSSKRDQAKRVALGVVTAVAGFAIGALSPLGEAVAEAVLPADQVADLLRASNSPFTIQVESFQRRWRQLQSLRF